MTRRARILHWLAARLPLPLSQAPERVFINAICCAVGLAVLLSDQPSSLWSHSVGQLWGLIMFGGGAAALVGYWRSGDRGRTGALERVGYLAIMLAAVSYAVRAMAVFGWRATPIGGAFLAIAAAKAVRLLISSVAREQLLRDSGEEPGDAR